jgi:hypothetical protein
MGLVILNEETDARMGFHSDFTGACILPLRPGCFVVGEGEGLFAGGRARAVCVLCQVQISKHKCVS